MGRMLKRVWHVIECAWFYSIGNLMCLLFFDRKYITGPYFEKGRFGGVGAVGWRWAACSGASRIFLRANKGVPWPVTWRTHVPHPENIEFDPSDLHIFQAAGTYFQAAGAKIRIGKGTWIAPNVGLITSNHDKHDLKKHLPGKDIVIGKDCWIGMNSVILPGVVLGDSTIVGAGAVVTRSFPEGHCTIGGVPARIIRED